MSRTRVAKHTRRVLALVGGVAALVLLVTDGCTPANQPASADEMAVVSEELSAQDAAVRSRVREYLSATERRDTAAIRAQFVSSGALTWIESGALQYDNADAVLAGLLSLPADATITTSLDSLHVQRLGREGAHAWSRFTTQIGDEQTGFRFGGAISLLLERDETNTWHIVGGHTSSPSER